MDDLPSHTAEKLASLSVDQLVDLLVTDEDRVPRNVIDECARRGETMLDRLRDVFDSGHSADEDPTFGDWWLQAHAVMILGLMPDARAGHLLLQFMSRLTGNHDELNDWLNDPWPRLFENKPAEVIDAARTLANDRRRDWYERSSAQQAVLGAAVKSGNVDRELEWIANLAGDDSEEWTLRMLCASHLLDFPREPYRALLVDLARKQEKRRDQEPPMFFEPDVEQAYAGGRDRAEWKSRASPWQLYDPEEIEAREEHWATLEEGEVVEPYVRETPKIGRNDPCPCGSGKKYKRCCMPR